MAPPTTATTNVFNAPPMMLAPELGLEMPREGVMFIILIISFFAVSFPSLSKYVKFLRIPHIAFFIGKHFGTGVILSTAFCHLLQDAFELLQRPLVKEFHPGLGRWTGLIILGSLLSIFLIEYLSTTFVEHLHADPSAPPSPIATPSPSRPLPLPSSSLVPQQLLNDLQHSQLSIHPNDRPQLLETTPLIASHKHIHKRPAITTSDTSLIALPTPEYLTIVNSPRVLHANDHIREVITHARTLGETRPRLNTNTTLGGGPYSGSSGDLETAPGRSRQSDLKPRVGRRRQIIGILVLQLGIMIHSLVIGLTLAITSGADFTSLVTAISFHQLFEGLSLGIRIAALPPSPSLVITTPPSPKSVLGRALPILPTEASAPWWWPRPRKFNWLKPTLSILFALATPLSMAAGIKLFPREGLGQSPKEQAEMYMTQGIMNAISAGMLIYASTVEMMAGDFVFGDLGGSHPGHGHSHNHSEIEGFIDDSSAESSPASDGQHFGHHHHPRHDHHEHEYDPHQHHAQHFLWKRVLALLSLLAGVALMAIVGLNE
ncbi:hypothetical protein AX16_009860 [Volvariella volvacea WC 439]|nr:hypothetical protein AX16_009860 [Volvariella volvacea WC 439]